MVAVFAYSFWRLKTGKVTMKSVEEARRHAMEEINELDEA